MREAPKPARCGYCGNSGLLRAAVLVFVCAECAEYVRNNQDELVRDALAVPLPRAAQAEDAP